MDTVAVAIVAGLLGLIFGSFLTVVVDRVPKKESIVKPRSRCPQCGATIAARDNIPVVSYLLVRGRCRTCGAHISARYPILEATTGVVFAATSVVAPTFYVGAMLCAFGAVMLAVAAIDLELRIIPNRITYPAIPAFAVAIVVGWLANQPLDLARAAVGLLAYGGGFLLLAIISPRGLGMGDVKLAALIGLVLGSLGLRFVGVAAFGAVVLGGLGAIVALIGGRGRKSHIPFGPYMAAGAIVAVVWGAHLADLYLGTMR